MYVNGRIWVIYKKKVLSPPPFPQLEKSIGILLLLEYKIT